MRFLKLCLLLSVVIACGTAFAQSGQKQAGFDLKAIDKSVDPCDNFYQFACGSWIKNNPIPADQSRWGRFNELIERNNEVLRGILEKSASGGTARNATDQKIGDFYGACMDEKAIDAKGINSLKPELDAIDSMKSKADLTAVVTKIHAENGPGFFSFGSGQDFKDATKVIAQYGQDGLGLPNKDYYFKDDPKSKDIRDKYVVHMTNMFKLMGEPADKAEADARRVMEIETSLAQGSLAPVDMRDPAKVYHKMTMAELNALTPGFQFQKYLVGIGAPKIDAVNVAQPEFAKTMQQVIDKYSVDDLKTYMRWQVIHGAAPLLSTNFVNENFDFYGKTMRGAKELRPRWKRCVAMVDEQLGEALGIAYVEKTFGAEGKARMLQMVKNLESALGEDIQNLDWMTPETKKQAAEKLAGIANKIGYPEKWRDYSSIKVVPNNLMADYHATNTFELHRQLNKIGQPVDKKEWGMTPPTVNAYYDPLMNDINFPAGILQPPFFTKGADNAANYGAIGAVIGHEMTHGFDDEGRQFDAKGNLRDWWTPADSKAFDQRADCIVQEYNSFAVGDEHVNGKLTLGENTADNGGARIALMAYLESIKGKPDAKEKLEGYTPEQRFFLGFGQIWCQNMRPEAARMQVLGDPHSPGEFRVNGTVRNMPEFRKAWGCKAAAPMAPENSCHVW
jgi:endothelin-converting enzyme/putative endopeptidase